MKLALLSAIVASTFALPTGTFSGRTGRSALEGDFSTEFDLLPNDGGNATLPEYEGNSTAPDDDDFDLDGENVTLPEEFPEELPEEFPEDLPEELPGGDPDACTCRGLGGMFCPGDTYTSRDGCNTCFCAPGGHGACTMRICSAPPHDHGWSPIRGHKRSASSYQQQPPEASSGGGRPTAASIVSLVMTGTVVAGAYSL